MRRRDREMGREFGLEVIDKSSYGVVSMIDEDNEPYGIPLSIVRDGDNLYFHSALDGKKVKIFEKNPTVSVVFVGQIKIPENFSKEELAEMVNDKSKAGALISKVFTTEYESAIVKGKIKLVENEIEKLKSIKLICEKYTPTKIDYFNLAIESGLQIINMYKIEIEEITAKRKKYDMHGEEMKWGRME
ncbi:MAG: pyridoxamine 5'-phosphate oxidase family protein [Sedimentibacter sp.]